MLTTVMTFSLCSDYDTPDITFGTSIERRSNSEKKRHVKIGHFKSLIESKIFSKSDKDLARTGILKTDEKQDDVSINSLALRKSEI